MIDASLPEVTNLFLSEETIARAIRKMHGDDVAFHISMIDRYDEYYLSIDNTRPLPVYKVDVDNYDRSVYYIDPTTGNHKYLNTNRRVKKWLFSAFHYLDIRWLVERHTLWTIALWTLCLGGSSSLLYRSMAGCKIYLPEAKEEINIFSLQYFLLQRPEPDKSYNPFQHAGNTDGPPNSDNT